MKEVGIAGRVLNAEICRGKDSCPVMKLMGQIDLSRPGFSEALCNAQALGLELVDPGVQKDSSTTLTLITFRAVCIQRNPEGEFSLDPALKIIASALYPEKIICGQVVYTVFERKTDIPPHP